MDAQPLPRTLWRRAISTALACLVLLVAVYLAAVWTPAGQRFEDAVLDAAARAGGDTAPAGALGWVSVPSVIAALAVVLAIGLSRRRPLLCALAAAVVAASVLTGELVQRSVLRPILLDSGVRREDQSFPSGHAAVAMSVMCALVLVAPYRWRGLVLGLAFAGASSVEIGTVSAGWHRPSDTIGSDLIVVMYTCAAVAVLARLGRVSEANVRTTAGRAARVALGGGFAGLALAAFVVAVAGTVFTAGRALALAGSAAVALCLLALLRRVELTGEPR